MILLLNHVNCNICHILVFSQIYLINPNISDIAAPVLFTDFKEFQESQQITAFFSHQRHKRALDAHYSKKNTTSWVGYKVHLSETCEPNSLHLITNVETTAAPIADGDVTEAIHTSLANKDLLPSKHIVDTGYLDAQLLVTAQQQHQVQLLGPTRSDLRWQSRAGKGFAASDFKVDWQLLVAVCPEGKTITSWTPAIDGRDNEVIKIKFARADCANCPSLHLCTRTKEKRRLVTLRKEAQYKALQAARKQATTDDYKADYARAGWN